MKISEEYHISECCEADLFFKGEGQGFWCSKCKNEITRTIVAFDRKGIEKLKQIALSNRTDS